MSATVVAAAAAGTVVAVGALGGSVRGVQSPNGASNQPTPAAIPADQSGSVVSGQAFRDPPIISAPGSQ